MKDSKSVREIVEAYIRENGFDGLFNSDLECACRVDDLEPCGCFSDECQVGCEYPCPKSTCGEHDYHIGTRDAAEAAARGEEVEEE